MIFISPPVAEDFQITKKKNKKKKKKKKKNNSDVFLYSCSGMGCGCPLEQPRRGGSNEYLRSVFQVEIGKIMYIPSFTI